MYHIATIVMMNVRARTESLMILLFVSLLFPSRITPKYTVMNCLGRERIAARQKTMIPIPHVEKIAVVTKDIVQEGRDRMLLSLTMARDRTQASDESNLEPSISYNASQAGIRNLCPFQLESSSSAAIFECAIAICQPRPGTTVRYALKVAHFAYERASGNDSESYP